MRRADPRIATRVERERRHLVIGESVRARESHPVRRAAKITKPACGTCPHAILRIDGERLNRVVGESVSFRVRLVPRAIVHRHATIGGEPNLAVRRGGDRVHAAVRESGRFRQLRPVLPIEKERAVVRGDPRIAAGVEGERVGVIALESEFRPRLAVESRDARAVRADPDAVLFVDRDRGEIIAGDRRVGRVERLVRRAVENRQPAAARRDVGFAIAANRDAADPRIAQSVRRRVRDPVLVLHARRAVRRADPRRAAWLERDAGDVIRSKSVALGVGLKRRRIRARGEREKEEQEEEQGEGEEAGSGLQNIESHGPSHIGRDAHLRTR